jgi:hypothetical protein
MMMMMMMMMISRGLEDDNEKPINEIEASAFRPM